jgi:hypothetical protein
VLAVGENMAAGDMGAETMAPHLMQIQQLLKHLGEKNRQLTKLQQASMDLMCRSPLKKYRLAMNSI